MDNQMLYYSLTLTEDQVKYLRDKKYKIDRMECFMSLLDHVVRVTTLVQITKDKQIEILPGQIMTDHTQLAELWGKDRKTVPKILKAMEELDILSSQKVEDSRVLSLHCLSGWMENGQLFTNPFGLRRNPVQTAYFHAEVRPTRVFPVEVDTTQNTDEAASKSKEGNHPAENLGQTSPPAGQAAQPSSQSNDGGNVGTSGSEVRTSAPSAGNISPQSTVDRNSVGSSPQSGTVANPNEGNQKERPQQPPSPPSQPNNAQRPPFNGNQGNPPGSNGFSSPNGSQNPQR